jgi:hypothetical protein
MSPQHSRMMANMIIAAAFHHRLYASGLKQWLVPQIVQRYLTPRNSSFKHKMVVRKQVLISERLYQLIMGTLLEAATRSPDLHMLAGRPHLLDRIVKEW